jgi:hypothetical protein
MDREPLEAKATKTTFVYDTRTGKVVHVHQFIPYDRNGTMSDREMEEMALKLAPPVWDRSRLSVLHHAKDLELNPEHDYRVDVKNRKLLVQAAPTRPAQERRRRAVAPRKAPARTSTKRASTKG